MVKDAKELPQLTTLRFEVGQKRTIARLPQGGEKKSGGEAALIDGLDYESVVGAHVESRRHIEGLLPELRLVENHRQWRTAGIIDAKLSCGHKQCPEHQHPVEPGPDEQIRAIAESATTSAQQPKRS